MKKILKKAIVLICAISTALIIANNVSAEVYPITTEYHNMIEFFGDHSSVGITLNNATMLGRPNTFGQPFPFQEENGGSQWLGTNFRFSGYYWDSAPEEWASEDGGHIFVADMMMSRDVFSVDPQYYLTWSWTPNQLSGQILWEDGSNAEYINMRNWGQYNLRFYPNYEGTGRSCLILSHGNNQIFKALNKEFGYTYLSISYLAYTGPTHNPKPFTFGPFRCHVDEMLEVDIPQTTWGASTDRILPMDGGFWKVGFDGEFFPAAVLDREIWMYNGNNQDKEGIGITALDAEIIDSHRVNPWFYTDATYMHSMSRVSWYTHLAPSLSIEYSDSPLDISEHNIPSSTQYDVQSEILPCGGEDGWTRYPLNIRLDGDNIVGEFGSLLKVGEIADQFVSGPVVFHANYHTESPSSLGTPVSGVLTEIGDPSNLLSGEATDTIRIDKTPPTANATYNGNFHFTDLSWDALSGLSTVINPTQINFTAPADGMLEPTLGWEDITDHTMRTRGIYDVWIRATDKAGNTTVRKAFPALHVGGEVSITKDTDLGAVLHSEPCKNHAEIVVARDESTNCEPDCVIGATPQIDRDTTFTYEITITNHSTQLDAAGRFEDYLPEEVTLSDTLSPDITSSDGTALTTIVVTPHVSGNYMGRDEISGLYSGLKPGEQIVITIPCEISDFVDAPDMGGIISNQATTEWTIGTGPEKLEGTITSNHANHQVVEDAGVNTKFTKVSATDLTTGLVGAEFALYYWDSEVAPTQTELETLVDAEALSDGYWVRAKQNGETPAALTDIFTPAIAPQGEVDLGNLPEGIYTLIETKAPAGYELPVGQWILTVDPDKTDTGEGDYKIEFIGKSNTIMPPAAVRESDGTVHTYKIINVRPFTVGMSGLGGTRGILLAGFVLMALAGNTYIVYSNKAKKG